MNNANTQVKTSEGKVRKRIILRQTEDSDEELIKDINDALGGKKVK